LRFHVQTLSRFSSASLLCFGMNPCNRKFEILHLYTVSCIYFLRKYTSETFCAGQNRAGSSVVLISNFPIGSAGSLWPCIFHLAPNLTIIRYHFNKMHGLGMSVDSIHAQTKVVYQFEAKFYQPIRVAESAFLFAGPMSAMPRYFFNEMYLMPRRKNSCVPIGTKKSQTFFCCLVFMI
jgi:hypothetical protein